MTPTDGAPVRVDDHGAVRVVVLDRPAARNAVDVATRIALSAAMDEADVDDSVRAIVLTADTESTGVFCAGADLRAIAAGQAAELSDRHGFAGFARRVRQTPVVAAVDGLALGGGCEIVLACDLVVCTPRSAFGLPEVRRNLLASAGGLIRLPRAVGTRVALEAALTGEPLTAERAHQLGMVNRLCEPGGALEAALALARTIALGAPAASAAARALVLATWDRDEADLEAEAREVSVALRDMADTQEGIDAFFAGRAPVWSGS